MPFDPFERCIICGNSLTTGSRQVCFSNCFHFVHSQCGFLHLALHATDPVCPLCGDEISGLQIIPPEEEEEEQDDEGGKYGGPRVPQNWHGKPSECLEKPDAAVLIFFRRYMEELLDNYDENEEFESPQHLAYRRYIENLFGNHDDGEEAAAHHSDTAPEDLRRLIERAFEEPDQEEHENVDDLLWRMQNIRMHQPEDYSAGGLFCPLAMPAVFDSFHCNVCFATPSPSSTHFRLTNCCHIICEDCFSKNRTGESSADSGKCGRCQKECTAKKIGAGLQQNALKLFVPIEKTMADEIARLLRLVKFQDSQLLALSSHVNMMHDRLAELSKSDQEKTETINKLENELKSTQLAMEFFKDQLKKAKTRELERTSNHNQSRTQYPNATGTADELLFMDSTESTGNFGFSLSSTGFPTSIADISTDLDSSAASSNAMSFTSIVNSCPNALSFPQAQCLPPRSAPHSASRPATTYSSSRAEQQTFAGSSTIRTATSNADFSPFATQAKHSSAASTKKRPLIASGLTTPGILCLDKIKKHPRPNIARSAGALHGRSPLTSPPSHRREETANNPYLQSWKKQQTMAAPSHRTTNSNVGMSGGGCNTGGGRGRFTPTAGAGSGNFTPRKQNSQMRPVSQVSTRRITPRAFSPATFNYDSP